MNLEENTLRSKKQNHYSSECRFHEAEDRVTRCLRRAMSQLYHQNLSVGARASYSATLGPTLPLLSSFPSTGLWGTSLLPDHLADRTLNGNINAFSCGHTQNLASQQEVSFESGATGETDGFTSITLDRKKGKVLEAWHGE